MFCFLISCCFVLLVAGDGDELTVEPINLVAVVGREAVFSCRARSEHKQSLQLQWRRRALSHLLYSNVIPADRRPRYSVETVDDDGGRGLDVVVKSVRADDAGQYLCAPSNDTDGSAASSAVCELVVLGAPPHCTTQVLAHFDVMAVAGPHLSLNCTLGTTSVNFDPGMSWIDPAGDRFLRTHHLSPAIQTSPLDQGPMLVARLRSADDDLPTKQFDLRLSAATGPTELQGYYVFDWSSANVSVLLSAKNVRIHSVPPSNCCSAGEEHVLALGDQLVCEADGQPEVRFYWEEREISEVWTPALDAHNTHRRHGLSTIGRHLLRCTASNVIGGRTYSDSLQIAVHVVPSRAEPAAASTEAKVSTEVTTASALYVVLGVSVVVVAMVVAVACGVNRRRNKMAVDRRRRDEVDKSHGHVDVERTSAVAADLQSFEPAVEHPAPDVAAVRRRTMPLPAIVIDDTSQHDYDDVVHGIDGGDDENHPYTVTTRDPPAADDEVDALPSGNEPTTPAPGEPNTTPKSFFDPSPTLDLRSCTEEEAIQTPVPISGTLSNNKYITLLGVEESKACTSAAPVYLCCSDTVLST